MEPVDKHREPPIASCELPCRLVNRHLDEVRPHASYVKHSLSVSGAQLSALIAAGENAFRQPILVTGMGTIIDGYARWELAKRQNRQTILCLEYDISEEEALRWLIQNHLPSKGFNGFCRSQLASDLEPSLRETSRSNQQKGGQIKGCSTLTEAQRVDSRQELAKIARVSTGQFTKAKQLVASSPSAIQDAVKAGEISVHQAWQWTRSSAREQLMNLEELRSRKGTSQTSRRLIQAHVARMRIKTLAPPNLTDVLEPLIPDRLAILNSIVVSEIDAPGRVAYFTKEALQTLQGKNLDGRT